MSSKRALSKAAKVSVGYNLSAVPLMDTTPRGGELAAFDAEASAARRDALLTKLATAKAASTLPAKASWKADVATYYADLIKEATGANAWKIPILNDEKARLLKLHDDDIGERDAKLDEAHDTVRKAYHWIVPRPVDPAVVAAVIARDRAAWEKEHPKEVPPWR